MTCFYGDYTHALDSQCRVSLPCDWRQKDGNNELILAPTGDRALALFPPELLADFFDRMRTASITNGKVQRALADFGRMCKRCKCDKQGRIALDREMLNSIGVTSQLQLSGAVTHIRINAPGENSSSIEETLATLDEVNMALNGSVDSAIRNIIGAGK